MKRPEFLKQNILLIELRTVRDKGRSTFIWLKRGTINLKHNKSSEVFNKCIFQVNQI